jgi:tRNA(Arg) A34 adenosine deaminase TadA
MQNGLLASQDRPAPVLRQHQQGYSRGRRRNASSCQRLPSRRTARRPCGCVTVTLDRQKAATLTATLHGNPIEHGNIRAIESAGKLDTAR